MLLHWLGLRTYRWLTLAGLISLPLVTVAAPAAPKAGNAVWVNYEPERVTLTGTLVVKLGYGAPNYGEDPAGDAKEYYPVLLLETPINVKGNPADDINRETVLQVREVQLVVRGQGDFKYKHMRLKITGTLFHSQTGHHHTDVLLSVETITRLDL